MSTPVRNADVAQVLASATPRPGLFRGVYESTALWPLVIVLAFFPGLYALAHRNLTEEAALWNLRAMEVLAANDFAGIMAPGSANAGAASSLEMLPPLSSWVSAGSLWILGRYPTAALALPSYLFGAGIVAMTFLLGSQLLSRSTGLVGCLLIAGSAPLLLHIQMPLPHTAGVATALASLFCFLKQMQAETSRSSRWLLLGGGAWGLCLLASGPFALMVPATMVLHLICLKLRSNVPLRSALRDLAVPWRWPPLAAAWLFLLLGLVVAGWWYFYQSETYGLDFWKAWWSMLSAKASTRALPLSLVPVMPATLVLAIGGVARILKICFIEKRAENDPLDRPLFLTIWVCLATLAVLRSSAAPGLLRLYLIVPLLLLAADSLMALAQRRLSLESGAILMAATVSVVGLWSSSGLQEAVLRLFLGGSVETTDWLHLHLYLDMVVLLSVATWLGYRGCLASDRRQRLAIVGFIIAVVGFSLLRGLVVTRRDTDDDRQLARLRRVLAALPTRNSITLVSDEQPPALLCTLRYRTPRFPVLTYSSWNAWHESADLGRQGLVVHWSRRPSSPAALLSEGYTMDRVGNPLVYQDKELMVYDLRPTRHAVPQ